MSQRQLYITGSVTVNINLKYHPDFYRNICSLSITEIWDLSQTALKEFWSFRTREEEDSHKYTCRETKKDEDKQDTTRSPGRWKEEDHFLSIIWQEIIWTNKTVSIKMMKFNAKSPSCLHQLVH